jgi:hypothetical protein
VKKNVCVAPSFEDIVHLKQILALEWYPSPTDSKETWDRAWNHIQLIAAFSLIRHFFGDKWYKLVFREVIKNSTVPKDPSYLRYVRSSRIHPLTKMALTGRPEIQIRIVRLGEALKVLGFAHNDTNLSVKLDELRSDSFAAAYFELKIALIYAHSGFDVKFLKARKGSKSPDLLITRDGVETFVECKKRKPESGFSLEARIGGVVDRLRDAHEQIAAVSKHGIVYIEVEDNLEYSSPEIVAYTNNVRATLLELPEVSCAILSREKIENRDNNVVALVTDARGIPNPKTLCPFPREVWCNPRALTSDAPVVIVDLPPPMAPP